MAEKNTIALLKLFATFIAAFLTFIGLLWLPSGVGFELEGTIAFFYAILTVLPILGIFFIYTKIFLKADEFFQRRYFLITSLAFLLSGFYGILSITFSTFGLSLFLGQSIWPVLAISWLISLLIFQVFVK